MQAVPQVCLSCSFSSIWAAVLLVNWMPKCVRRWLDLPIRAVGIADYLNEGQSIPTGGSAMLVLMQLIFHTTGILLSRAKTPDSNFMRIVVLGFARPLTGT